MSVYLGNQLIAGAQVKIESIPVGSLMPYAGSIAPDGWLLCDGRAVSRTTYSDLFSVIGDTYGVGDGSTTFNLPDCNNYKYVASDTASVCGNGLALGLTDTVNNVGIRMSSGGDGVVTQTDIYGVAVGTSNTNTNAKNNRALGVTPDPDKSGIIANLSTNILNMIIKF